ncbi:GNAT family N-acetyltransferase [Qipengyuania zhejiangensis]|uniref:GNAT family N-acetyltransferase n=1 Tax=Qipengyuania zhejiangensis TaxID=3077782 RepID=UPI002D76F480|nr:GNAT family N-acetyltransferase [Qipengyuania sp. Z2]
MSAIDQLMAVMEAAFDPHWREAWTRAQVEGSLAMPHTFAVLLDEDGKPPPEGSPAAGFVLARRAPGEVELLLIAVHPDSRGQGLGRKLIDCFCQVALESEAEQVFLEMRANNSAASLYESCGFKPIGRRKGYYRTTDGEPVDAITYGKKL